MPVLIGLGCVLVVAPAVDLAAASSRRDAGARRTARCSVWVLVVLPPAIYGGYFGAAQGVLLIAILGLGLAETLQRINAAKNVLAASSTRSPRSSSSWSPRSTGGRRPDRRRLDHRRRSSAHRRPPAARAGAARLRRRGRRRRHRPLVFFDAERSQRRPSELSVGEPAGDLVEGRVADVLAGAVARRAWRPSTRTTVTSGPSWCDHLAICFDVEHDVGAGGLLRPRLGQRARGRAQREHRAPRRRCRGAPRGARAGPPAASRRAPGSSPRASRSRSKSHSPRRSRWSVSAYTP